MGGMGPSGPDFTQTTSGQENGHVPGASCDIHLSIGDAPALSRLGRATKSTAKERVDLVRARI